MFKLVLICKCLKEDVFLSFKFKLCFKLWQLPGGFGVEMAIFSENEDNYWNYATLVKKKQQKKKIQRTNKTNLPCFYWLITKNQLKHKFIRNYWRLQNKTSKQILTVRKCFSIRCTTCICLIAVRESTIFVELKRSLIFNPSSAF